MLFPTLDFALFFLLTVTSLAVIGDRFQTRKWGLIALSYVFYAQWSRWFCLLLLWCTVVSFSAGLLVARSRQSGRSGAGWVALAITVQLSMLAFFKYFDFLTGAINGIAHAFSMGEPLPFFEVLLPVGISFFTFHGISYVVDVHRGKVAVCRRLPDMLLYMAFFPQLVAGPIIRSSQFLPQLAAPRAAPANPAPLLLLILGGLFKKVVIANYLATDLVDPVFRDPLGTSSLDLLLAVYGYAVQIYCDFSGYTDIAIGVAGLLGIQFPKNFNQPYRAINVQDFWRRWHITLSEWLRDYLYVPLGGNRRGAWRTGANVMITMLLGGLWHGPGWTFLCWGGLHGLALLLTRRRWLPGFWSDSRPGRAVSIFVTFHFVCLTWLMFRSPDFMGVLLYLQGLAALDLTMHQATPFTLALILFGLGLHALPANLSALVQKWPRPVWPSWMQAAAFGAAIAAIDALGPDGVAPFIYFQF